MDHQIFDSAQLDAICHREGPLLVSAGPGSGKTTVIISHVRFLIRELHIDPGNILIVTFTKAAAVEMKERFITGHGSFDSNHSSPAKGSMAKADASAASPRFGTMHSVFLEILKKSASHKTISIINDIDRDSFLRNLLLQYSRQNGDHCLQDAVMDNNIEQDLIPRLSSHFSKIVNTSSMSSVSSAHPSAHPFDLSFPGLSDDVVMRLFRQYQTFKRSHGLMDFDDILLETRRLLIRDHDVAAYWQNKYRFILIDEFQDINELQYQCMHILEAPWNNLYVVGDDDQSIYGFRGSSPGIMQRFLTDHPGCRTVMLQQNYRAPDRILEPARNLIRHNRLRTEKEIVGRSGPTDAAYHLNCCRDQWEEYQRIAETARMYQHQGIPLAQQVLLLRSFQNLPDILLCMQRCGLPVQVIGADRSKSSEMEGLRSHFITKDILACFQLASLSESLHRVIHTRLIPVIPNSSNILINPKVPNYQGLKTVTTKRLSAFHQEDIPSSHKKDPVNSRIFHLLQRIRPIFLPHVSRYSLTIEHSLPMDPRGQQELKGLETHLAFLANLSPYLAFEYILKAMGYEMHLSRISHDSHSDIHAFTELLNALKDYLRQFQTIEQLSKMGNMRNIPDMPNACNKALTSADDPKGLQIRTMHSSKGLEYEAVYIPDLNKGIIPDSRAIGDAIEEERRLLYVAMTRAKRHLHLYYVERIHGKPVFPSLFISQLS